MKELSLPLIFAIFCFLVSFFFSLFSGISFFFLFLRVIIFFVLGFVFSLFMIKFLLYFVPDFDTVLTVLFDSRKEGSDSTDDEDDNKMDAEYIQEDTNDTYSNAEESTYNKSKDILENTQIEEDKQDSIENFEQKKLDEVISTQNKDFEYNNSSDDFDRTHAEIMLEEIKKEVVGNKEKIAKSISHFLKK